MSYDRRQIELGGSTVSYVDVGSGPAVVLASGFLMDADSWKSQIRALSSRYRVIVPELWGHGLSGPMPSHVGSIADVARSYADLLDLLGIPRVALVGISMGGMWGAELALLAPERVSALVLLDTSLAAEPEVTRSGYLGLLDEMERSESFPGWVVDAAAPLFFAPKIEERQPELMSSFSKRLLSWNGQRVVDSVVPLGRIIFNRREALADLGALEVPTMVGTGSEDQARTIAEGRAMANRIGCPFVEIPGAGHTPSLETPESLNRLLSDFLSQHI